MDEAFKPIEKELNDLLNKFLTILFKNKFMRTYL